MRLVKIDNDTFINIDDIEKISCLQAASPNFTYIYIEGDKKIKVEGSLYKIKKIIEKERKL